MKYLELKALLAAIVVSGLVVGSTLGGARLIQSSSSTSTSGPKTAGPNAAANDPHVAIGAKLFGLNCAHCHGIDATGDEGPDLHKVRKTDERIKSMILNGVKGEMPSFGKKFNEEDVRNLIAFIRSLSK
jgi:mono/diheme cytochrome c family protein